MTPGQQVLDLFAGAIDATRSIIDEQARLGDLSQILRETAQRLLVLCALVLGAAVLLGLLWLPLAPLPLLALNRILGEAGTLRRAWRVRRRQTDLLARWPAHAVAEAAQLIAAGKTLPDLPGEGPTVLLVSRRAANDEDDAPEATFLPAQDGAHARLALGAEAETPEGQARIAAIARDLLARHGSGPLLLTRDARGLVLFGPDPESDGTRLLAIRQDPDPKA